MAEGERWTGARSRSRSRSRSRGQDDNRRNRSPPQEHRRRSRSPDDRRRRRSRSRSRDDPYRRRGDDRRRRQSRSRSRSPERRDRDHRRERSPPRRRDRSPPSRGGYGGRRSGSRSPPPRPYGRGPQPPLPDFPPRGGYGRGPPPQQREALSDAPPEVGSIHHARVVSVRPFGVFVELPGFRKQALVHHSQISGDLHFGREDDDEMKIKAMEFFVPRGEKVWVKILEVRPEPGGPKLAASMRAVSQEDGRDLDPDNTLAAGGRGGPGGGGGGPGGRDSDQPPELHSIHHGAVQQVRPFGVFVKLDGYRKYGLVHFSQISDHLSFAREDPDDAKVREIGEILSVGDPVWVKVVDITFDERGPKIGCSIKLVSQSDGTDLDPANSKYRPRGDGGGGFQGQQPIGAAAGTTTKEGGVDWGHLKADVVQYGAGGQQYEILAGSEDEAPGPYGRGPPQRPGAPGAPGGGFGTGANTAPLPPRGRGSGAVLPAWMTGGGGGAPGSGGPAAAAAAAAEPGGGGGRHITSVEEALAILEEHARVSRQWGPQQHCAGATLVLPALGSDDSLVLETLDAFLWLPRVRLQPCHMLLPAPSAPSSGYP
ncbi:hypothetical protein ABPG75_009323 [Micractinium tetrahymenae]